MLQATKMEEHFLDGSLQFNVWNPGVAARGLGLVTKENHLVKVRYPSRRGGFHSSIHQGQMCSQSIRMS